MRFAKKQCPYESVDPLTVQQPLIKTTHLKSTVAFKTRVFWCHEYTKTANPVYVPPLLPTPLYERLHTNCSVNEEVPPARHTTGNPPRIRRAITARCAALTQTLHVAPTDFHHNTQPSASSRADQQQPTLEVYSLK